MHSYDKIQKHKNRTADICLFLEGSYPHTQGGVSEWVHSLIYAYPNLTFSIVAIRAKGDKRPSKYAMPNNVIGYQEVFLYDMPKGKYISQKNLDELMRSLFTPFLKIQNGQGGFIEFKKIYDLLYEYRGKFGSNHLYSLEAWNLLVNMYEEIAPQTSFLDFFWTFMAFIENISIMLLSDIPKAKVYHTISTGYAGLLAVNAKLTYNRPTFITEHGIYTNERRIEVLMADWLSATMKKGFGVDTQHITIRDIWINSFVGFSRSCYAACKQIITLYEGNQSLQIADGADPEKLRVIPNGINFEKYSQIQKNKKEDELVVGIIARVVPIKDLKTFLRACAIVLRYITNVRFVVMGATEEDKDYYAECLDIVNYYNLNNNVDFLGQVNITDHLPDIDVLVLTSLSEAQPLVLLEAGAAKIPFVATDVGCCRELAMGRTKEPEDIAIGQAGIITNVANPEETAKGIISLLSDSEKREKYGNALQERTRKFYNKQDIDKIYYKLYDENRG